MTKVSCGDVQFCRARTTNDERRTTREGPDGWPCVNLTGEPRTAALMAMAEGKLDDLKMRAFVINPVRLIIADDVRWDTVGTEYEAAYQANRT